MGLFFIPFMNNSKKVYWVIIFFEGVGGTLGERGVFNPSYNLIKSWNFSLNE
jgi:hypothetical protein